MKFIRVKTAVRHYARVLLISGPAGLVFAMRLARLERRQKMLEVYFEREKELHRDHMSALRHEQTTLIDAKQALLWAASKYWDAIRERQQLRELGDTINGGRP